MNTVKFSGLECVSLNNDFLELLVTQSVGPRIISLRFNDGDNLFAELPDAIAERPEGEPFRFYGGHRLWHAPETFPRTYTPDNKPVNIIANPNGCIVQSEIEAETGIEKTIEILLGKHKPQVIIHHTLTNHGLWPITCAPWAITQLKPGGVAILPQAQTHTGFLPNRALAIWPYTDIASPHISLGNEIILVRAEMESAFKIGFPNPLGWLAYWRGGTLFVKRANYDSQADYYDLGSSSECYCNDQFLELETLAPVTTLKPQESVTHTEIWELYADVERPVDEASAQAIIKKLELG